MTLPQEITLTVKYLDKTGQLQEQKLIVNEFKPDGMSLVRTGECLGYWLQDFMEAVNK